MTAQCLPIRDAARADHRLRRSPALARGRGAAGTKLGCRALHRTAPCSKPGTTQPIAAARSRRCGRRNWPSVSEACGHPRCSGSQHVDAANSVTRGASTDRLLAEAPDQLWMAEEMLDAARPRAHATARPTTAAGCSEAAAREALLAGDRRKGVRHAWAAAPRPALRHPSSPPRCGLGLLGPRVLATVKVAGRRRRARRVAGRRATRVRRRRRDAVTESLGTERGGRPARSGPRPVPASLDSRASRMPACCATPHRSSPPDRRSRVHRGSDPLPRPGTWTVGVRPIFARRSASAGCWWCQPVSGCPWLSAGFWPIADRTWGRSGPSCLSG